MSCVVGRIVNLRNWRYRESDFQDLKEINFNKTTCILAGKRFSCLSFSLKSDDLIDMYVFNPRLLNDLDEGSEGVVLRFAGTSFSGDPIQLECDFQPIGRADISYNKR